MPNNQSQPVLNRRGGAKGETTSQGQISAPAISLPKGGGAIRGIGEKFAANPVTGTGSMSVPSVGRVSIVKSTVWPMFGSLPTSVTVVSTSCTTY